MLSAVAEARTPAASTPQVKVNPQYSHPSGMVWIPGGEFTMGTDEAESYHVERPAHRVQVSGFWYG